MAANYVLLERVTTTSSVATITIDNIPQTGYTDLKLVISARGDAGSLPDVMLRFNGDSGSNYIARELTGNGASAGTGGYTTSDAHVQANGNTTTAATFNNAEIYIPNYRVAGVQKSFLGDAINENNTASTLVQSRLVAWRWTGTAAINTINILTNGGNYVANTTFSLYGIAALGTEPAILPKATGGDIVVSDGTYWYHAFLNSSVFTPSQPLNCDYLVVAGGGGGGTNRGAGGGAGGYQASTGLSVTSATPVTIGAGGAGGTVTGAKGSSGNNSVFSSITANAGGGGGGNSGNSVGINGGSGGGAGHAGTNTAGTGNQGSNGGLASASAAGGGGGATTAGAAASGDNGGVGGTGSNALSSWFSATGTGVSGYVAGGGGGGSVGAGTIKAGGAGGGGNGGTDGTAATDGTASTGSGGGGTGQAVDTRGGAGGSGIVIVRYTVA